MSASSTHAGLLARRAELMAELLLQDFEPSFLSRPTTDVGYDFLVGFANQRGGINTFAVEVKTTERPPSRRFAIQRNKFERLTRSNIPALLLVVDVKQNQFYFAWLSDQSTSQTTSIMVPIIRLDEASKRALVDRLRAGDGGVSAAG